MKTAGLDEVREFLKSYLYERLRSRGEEFADDLPDDCDLLLSGMIDSVGLLELMTAIQQHWQHEIDFEGLDAEEMTIVGPLCRYVSQRIQRP